MKGGYGLQGLGVGRRYVADGQKVRGHQRLEGYGFRFTGFRGRSVQRSPEVGAATPVAGVMGGVQTFCICW